MAKFIVVAKMEILVEVRDGEDATERAHARAVRYFDDIEYPGGESVVLYDRPTVERVAPLDATEQRL